MIDAIFQGGVDERFTDWDTARQFVIFDTIVNNPRFDADTKIKLQQIEQDAYDATYGQVLVSETEEIGQYYNYMKNQFPRATDDARFLAIYDAADDVNAGASSVGASDLKIPSGVKFGFFTVLGGILLFELLTRD